MQRAELYNLLLNNVLVLSFIKKTEPRKGWIRNMICTKSNKILSSLQGRINLNFRNPKYGGPVFNEVEHNVVVVWDILMQDYRVVPCESVNILSIIQEDFFWNFYNNKLIFMSSIEKNKFMNK